MLETQFYTMLSESRCYRAAAWQSYAERDTVVAVPSVCPSVTRWYCARTTKSINTQSTPHSSLGILFFGRPFVKRFAVCYRTVICLSCLSVYL